MSHIKDEKIKADAVIKTASQWFARLRSPEISEQEKKEFSEWLSADKTHEDAFVAISEVWDESGKLLAHKEEKNIGGASFLAWLFCRFTSMPLSFCLRWGVGTMAATAIVLMVFFGEPFHEMLAQLQGQTTIYRTMNAERKELKFSDGTLIEMNADSSLTAHICSRKRKVILEKGEAFFKVAHDPERPFQIHAEAGVITVLGTSFNVKNTKDSIAVDVAQGRVQVKTIPNASSSHISRAIVITNGQGVDYTSTGNLKKVRQARSTEVQSWRTDKIYFDATPLEDVAQIMRQQCDLAVFFPPIMLKAETFTGTFDRNHPREILEAMKIAFSLDLKLNSTYAQFTFSSKK